ncbi:MAG: hypothetical protein DCC43_12310 [Candidatus Brocadia sp.]|nr:MAG: hypothetical protein DCC43_12310 [Candidatus Brocadia sp.]
MKNYPSAAQPQPNFLYESGEIASEKALAMTATMRFDGTLHVVIASEAKQSFTHKKRHLLKEVCEKTYHKKRHLLKEVCEKTYKKKKFLYSNTIITMLPHGVGAKHLP